MAVIYMDSFDHWTGTMAGVKGWAAGGQGSISTAVLRTGVGVALCGTAGTGRQERNLPSDYATLIAGFAFYQPAAPNASRIFSFRDSGTEHVDIRHLASGRLRATRNGTTLGDGTAVLSSSVWYYIEVKVTISDTVGVVVVKVNGVTDINLSSQDTRNGALASVNQIVLEQGPSGQYYDDLYVLDTTGSAPTNDFLGDIKVEALLPNGNGNSSQFDGSDGNSTDNYLLVDEANPNGDTDYVQSPDVGDKDTYAYSNLVTTAGTVYAVQAVPYLRKTDAGSKNAVSVARLSATETDSATKLVLDSYRYDPDIREAKPGGGVWTVSDVNSAEFGLKVA